MSKLGKKLIVAANEGIAIARNMNLMDMDLIGCIMHKKQHIDVYRDKHGKFYVRNNGEITQHRLNAAEVVRWLLNAMNEE